MSAIDGKKRTVMYFGNASSELLLNWYNEVKSKLLIDGFKITHLSFGTKSKPSRKIVKANNTEKRYINENNEFPGNAKSWELYCIEDGEKDLAHRFILCMMLSVQNVDRKNELCAMISFDYSILDRLYLESYVNITKNYIQWNKEVIFDCGESDVPLNFAICQNPKVFREIKIISEIENPV